MKEFFHVKVFKETGEIVDFWASGIPVPELPEDAPFGIYPLLPENMIDGNHITEGQTYNIDTGMVEDTQISINNKATVALQKSDWVVMRHMEQRELQIDTSISEEEYTALLMWRQQTRESIK